MAFTLVWMRGPHALGTRQFEALGDATAFAEENLAKMRAEFGATAVKVLGADGTPHYLKAISRD